MPLALTIHDVSFVAHPEWFRPRERLRRRWLTRRSARAAAVVFTDSEFSRDEIVRHIRARSRPDRGDCRPASARGIDPSHDRPRRDPLVLFVGSLFNRRRLPELIAAFARATADLPDARLVIVGDEPHLAAAGSRAGRGRARRRRRGSRLRSYVDDGELATLYAPRVGVRVPVRVRRLRADAARSAGRRRPVVVLDTPVAREVYGDAASYVPAAADVTATRRRSSARLLDGSAANAARRSQHAAAVLARYSWDDAAMRTLAGIERTVRRP